MRHSSFISMLVALAAGLAASQSADAQLVMELPPEIAVASRAVSVADLVNPATATTPLLNRLADIDVGDVAEDTDLLKLRTSFIRIRVMLAGIDEQYLRITGPEIIHVRLAKPLPLTDTDIEAAAVRTLSQSLGCGPEDLQVSLDRPFAESVPAEFRSLPDLHVEVSAPLRPEPGQLSLNVRLWHGNNLVYTRSGRFDVLKRHRVMVSRVSLSRNTIVRPEDVQIEYRYLSRRVDEPSENEVYGWQVRANLPAGRVLSFRDLNRPKPQVAETVVKSRDTVRVTAISGGVQIQLRNAQAIQSGRVGDLISVRNLDSGRTFSGTVTGPGAVQIRLR